MREKLFWCAPWETTAEHENEYRAWMRAMETTTYGFRLFQIKLRGTWTIIEYAGGS